MKNPKCITAIITTVVLASLMVSSPFTVFACDGIRRRPHQWEPPPPESSPPESSPPPPPAEGIPMGYVYAAAATMVIAIIYIGGYLYKKKGKK